MAANMLHRKQISGHYFRQHRSIKDTRGLAYKNHRQLQRNATSRRIENRRYLINRSRDCWETSGANDYLPPYNIQNPGRSSRGAMRNARTSLAYQRVPGTPQTPPACARTQLAIPTTRLASLSTRRCKPTGLTLTCCVRSSNRSKSLRALSVSPLSACVRKFCTPKREENGGREYMVIMFVRPSGAAE